MASNNEGSTIGANKEGGLSEDQKRFLEECEKQFANRYTDQDKDFAQFKSAPAVPPPCVDPWHQRPPRNSDYRGGHGHGGGGRGGRYGGDRRDDRNRHEHERRREDYRDRSAHQDRRRY